MSALGKLEKPNQVIQHYALLPSFLGCPLIIYSNYHPKKKGGETTVDLDAIKKELGLTCDGLPLSEDEVDLVAMYRLLPEDQREDVFDLVHLKYQKHVERKKGSIFWTFTGDKNGGPAQGETPNGTA